LSFIRSKGRDKVEVTNKTMDDPSTAVSTVPGILGPPGRTHSELERQEEEDVDEEDEEVLTKDEQQREQALEQEPIDDTATLPVFETPVGTILEAAFVDPSYAWPPKDGEGQNAIELQASLMLLNTDGDGESIATTDTMTRRMRMPRRPLPLPKKWWQCCRGDVGTMDIEELRVYEEKKLKAQEAVLSHDELKRQQMRTKEKEFRKKHRYARVPEGILIYRLDTSTHELSLMSEPHAKTKMETLITEMKVVQAEPSNDKSRRGMQLCGADDRVMTLVACEQRTATAWLEAISLMLAKGDRRGFKARNKVCFFKKNWLVARTVLPRVSLTHNSFCDIAIV
jgi:hypothetical protein